MAAPLRSCACLASKLVTVYASSGVIILQTPRQLLLNNYVCSRKSYSSIRKKLKDPRKNTQYPYVPGDPLQEDAIKELATENDPIHKIAVKNKKINEAKVNEVQKASRIRQTKNGLPYEVLKEGDKRFGQSIMELKSTRPGLVRDGIILEGFRLVKDALALGAKIKCLFFCEPEMVEGLPKEYLQDTTLFKVTFKDMKVWADTTTPSGILGIFEKPQEGDAVAAPDVTLPITLIFDSVRDPGNAGTLIRTAAAIGCERLITTKGSVNVWEPKVIRSAMGGHFCLPIVTGLSWSDMHNYLSHETQIFLAHSRTANVLSKSFKTTLTDEEVTSQDLELSESDNETEDDKDAEELEREEMIKELKLEKKAHSFHKVPLTVYDYSDIPITSPNRADDGADGASVALIVGGEAEGLSALAKKFAYDHYGNYVTIPMSKNVNSLNAGIAGSLILYELRRKLMALQNKQNNLSTSATF